MYKFYNVSLEIVENFGRFQSTLFYSITKRKKGKLSSYLVISGSFGCKNNVE